MAPRRLCSKHTTSPRCDPSALRPAPPPRPGGVREAGADSLTSAVPWPSGRAKARGIATGQAGLWRDWEGTAARPQQGCPQCPRDAVMAAPWTARLRAEPP